MGKNKEIYLSKYSKLSLYGHLYKKHHTLVKHLDHCTPTDLVY